MVIRASFSAVVVAFFIHIPDAHSANTVESATAQAKSAMAAALSADKGSGIQIAVMLRGKIVFSQATGWADLESDVPLATDTRMRIGSLSKLYTYAAAARLAQQGRLDIDADIRSYVTEFPDKGRTITARHIANHTSGIRHYDFSNMAEANNTQFYPSLSDALQLFAQDPLLGDPGIAVNYSSFAVILLGVAIERASDLTYAAALENEVLRPLRLRNTFIDHPLQIIPQRTRFYTVWDGQLINTIWRDSSDYYPSGGLLSTAEDLVAMAHAVFDSEFLDAERRELMRTETRLGNGESTGYTFGWQVSTLDSGELIYHHGGETNGAYGHIVYLSKAGLIVAGLANYNVYPDQHDVKFFDLVRTRIVGMFNELR